jgi:hypothetical protein
MKLRKWMERVKLLTHIESDKRVKGHKLEIMHGNCLWTYERIRYGII